MDKEEAIGCEFANGVKQMMKRNNEFKAATAPGENRNIWFTD